MSPDEIRRLVKNRNAREYRAKQAADAAELEQLDYQEELVARYIEGDALFSYIDGRLDAAVPQAISAGKPFYILFSWSAHDFDGEVKVEFPPSHNKMGRKVFGMSVQINNRELPSGYETVIVIAEAVRAYMEDNGYDVGEMETGRFWYTGERDVFEFGSIAEQAAGFRLSL